MDSAIEAPARTEEEQKAVDNTIGAIKVIEALHYAVQAGSFPLRVHDQVNAGMSFLAQMHKQLRGQLPKEVVEKLEAEAKNGTQAGS